MIFNNVRNLQIILIFFLLALLDSSITAQTKYDFNIVNFSNNDYIHETSATSIYEDKSGYMWIATTYDLIRFDGNKFTFIDLPPLNQFEHILAISEYENSIIVLLSNGKLLLLNQDNIFAKIKEVDSGFNFFRSVHRNKNNI